MITHKVESLSELMERLNDDFSRFKGAFSDGYSNFLFRGHSSERWELETTLDRFLKKENIEKTYTVEEYVDLIFRAEHEFSSYTGTMFLKEPRKSLKTRGWQDGEFDADKFLPPHPETRKFYQSNGWRSVDKFETLSNETDLLEFAIYLRHFGFPSPFLDWTRSCYIAAFFAYEMAYGEDDVAIYVYREFSGDAKSYDYFSPRICTVKGNIHTSVRHHLQQAEYTCCLCSQKYDEEIGFELLNVYDEFGPHETVFFNNTRNQDCLIKYTLPISKRKQNLSHLNEMNINSYTLFRNEEALSKYLSTKLFK